MQLIKTDLIGEIMVESGKLFVGDPCYLPDDPAKPEENSMYGGVIVEGAKGTGKAYVDIVDEGAWGVRVSALRLVFPTVHSSSPSEVVLGYVGVDSGQMSMLDEMLIAEWGGDLRGDEAGFGTDFDAYCKAHAGEFNYAGICHATLSQEKGGVIGQKIAASQSGIGDGTYPVYVSAYPDGTVQSVEVRFLEDEEEPEDRW